MALADAMAVASDAEADGIGAELVELALPPEEPAARNSVLKLIAKLRTPNHVRTSGVALRALARRWSALSQEIRNAARSAGRGRWTHALAGISSDPDARARLSAARLIGQAGDAAVGELIPGLLEDPDRAVSQAAEESAVMLAIGAVAAEIDAGDVLADAGIDDPASGHGQAPPEMGEGDRSRVRDHIARGVAGFARHQRRGVLLAAAVLLDRAAVRAGNDALSAWLTSGDQQGSAALKGLLRWARTPVLRLRAWEWACRPDLAAAAVDRLGRASRAQEHELVLRELHLAARPCRARLLARVDPARATEPRARGAERDSGPVPIRAHLARLSTDARRHLPRFLAMIRGTPDSRRAALEPLLSDQDAIVRFAAARFSPARAADDFCFDRDDRVARHALLLRAELGSWSTSRLALSRPDAPPGPHAKLARSPHDTVRAWARQELALTAGPDSLKARLVARRATRANPDAFLSELRLRLVGHDAPDQVSAVRLIRRLELSDRFAGELSSLARTPPTDPTFETFARVIATAAGALGDVDSAAAGNALLELTRSPDARVRANAAEAIALRARRASAAVAREAARALTELKSDPHHRVRANVVRAILGVTPRESLDPILQDVLAMLNDDRPPHRLAGLWVCGRSVPRDAAIGRAIIGRTYAAIAARIAEIARQDDEPRARSRALAWRATVRPDAPASPVPSALTPLVPA